ncbi:DNA repair protein RecO (recombination protein O) [Oikeobacillus pervagus]|uniref:DNA repair protein RecO n=1 Tax=Oikeobacillus pervagus TaxID=1325931 RepID=A0AAJ1SY67_9BACI|nr:DNA repair protein RecO [Oikeobacillus pervagus]MDQ0213912.1 DNA repair protein RecO (recombination protein O) [Oikeobacillus pervagus]
MFQKCEGIVIRTTNYGESNKITTIFSREFGKIGLMARGAKKPNSRLSAITQLFTHGQFLFQKTSGLGTLQQGEMTTTMRNIKEDLIRTSYASYIVELLDKGVEDRKPNPYLFELLLQTLQYIHEGYDNEIVTNIFEMKMLQVIGISPELNQCVHCGEREGRFAFSIRENGFLCHRCFEVDPYLLPISQATAKLLRLFYYFDLNRLGDIHVKEQTKKEIRTVISMYYDEYSGLYLKSRRFLEQMERMKDFLHNPSKD